MAILYTHGATVTLTPAQFAAYTAIMAEPGDVTTAMRFMAAPAKTR